MTAMNYTCLRKNNDIKHQHSAFRNNRESLFENILPMYRQLQQYRIPIKMYSLTSLLLRGQDNRTVEKQT